MNVGCDHRVWKVGKLAHQSETRRTAPRLSFVEKGVIVSMAPERRVVEINPRGFGRFLVVSEVASWPQSITWLRHLVYLVATRYGDHGSCVNIFLRPVIEKSDLVVTSVTSNLGRHHFVSLLLVINHFIFTIIPHHTAHNKAYHSRIRGLSHRRPAVQAQSSVNITNPLHPRSFDAQTSWTTRLPSRSSAQPPPISISD